MGLFFQEREGLGKAHAEKGGKGGRHLATVGSMQRNAWKTYGDPPPAYIIAPAEHFPPSFSFFKKETHGRPLLFERAKLLRTKDSLHPVIFCSILNQFASL